MQFQAAPDRHAKSATRSFARGRVMKTC